MLYTHVLQYNLYSILFILQYIITMYSTLYRIYSEDGHGALNAMYSVLCTLCTILCTLYSVLCALYSVHCNLYIHAQYSDFMKII